MAGIAGSAGYEADKEWYAFENDYTPASPDNSYVNDDPVNIIYGCDDKIMRDKLNAISAKYGLTLHTERQFVLSGRALFSVK